MRWRRGTLWPVFYGLPALPVALMVAYAKIRWLQLGGFRIATRGLAQDESHLSAWDRLSFVRGDLLVGLVILPLFLAGLAVVLRPRWRTWGVASVVTIISLAFYLQVRALASVGTFLHANLWVSAARFATERPEYVGAYASPGGIIKVALVIALGIAIAVVAGRFDPGQREVRLLPKPLRVAGWSLVAAGVLGTAISWLPRFPATPFHRPMLVQALSAYVSGSPTGGFSFAGLSADELRQHYRDMVGVPPTPVDSSRWGRARGFDVIVVVLETVPAQCLNFAGPLDRFPTLRRLRARAIVARRHHTVYPYSSLANFSLLSSWYPPEFARSYMDRHTADTIPTVLWELRTRGYRTVHYAPYQSLFENDPAMYHLLGIERMSVAGVPAAGERPTWAWVARADSTAVRTMLHDIGGWVEARVPYAILFAPQTSHAPWNDPVPGRNAPERLHRCRALVEVQDGLIGMIVDTLERLQRLDRTILIVLGDHGIRTRAEDPRFVPGILDDYSFHVPLMISAPGVLDSTLVLDDVTSNVDVAPTLLDLLGLERRREREQGNALWDPAIGRRTTFLLANQLFGATGLHRNGRFVQWNHVSGVVCASDGVLRCAGTDMLAPGTLAADSIRTELQRFASLQKVWLEQQVHRGEAAP